ncbi:hypothetical protein JX265_009484 [Neoarthrinium moseri]|uniref:Uncharacterized protein n=1 Tax=Neoarthrinium moseri TaxID=1658444 RepID=A0A9P9WG18_9PEZI|nr:hypothetical protein JX265_009484 [Neoarthrinium moseri]
METTVQHRQDRLPLTSRWTGNQEPIVTSWEPSAPQVVQFTINCEALKFEAIPVTVALTSYEDGDATFRNYKDNHGKTQQLKLPPVAVKDLAKFRSDLEDHVKEHATTFTERQGKLSGLEVIRLAADKPELSVVIRHLLFYEWLEKLWGEILPTLTSLMESGQARYLHVAYVVLQLLGDGNKVITSDRERHGLDNDEKGVSLPETVQSIKQSFKKLVQELQSNCSSIGYNEIHKQLSVEEKEYHATQQRAPKETTTLRDFELPPFQEFCNAPGNLP